MGEPTKLGEVMPVGQEFLAQIQNLAYELQQINRRLQYTERRVRAVRAEAFVQEFEATDIGELGDISTFLDFKEIAVPTNPDSGWRRVFASTVTNKLSIRTSSGTTINLEFGSAEAITAVESEATLDLTGDVTIATGKSLSVNTINEKTANIGVTIDGLLIKDKTLISPWNTLTIANGLVTRTQLCHDIAGQGGAADNLAGISGGADGMLLIIHAASDAITITVKHNDVVEGTNGNRIFFSDNSDQTLDDIDDILILLYDSGLDGGNGGWMGLVAGGGGGATTFLALTDTPASYATHGGKFVKVNAGETALEFIASSVAGHAFLSASHTDVTVQAVTRGSLIYGDATPTWNELVIGAAGTLLRSDGTDCAWTTIYSTRAITFTYAGTLAVGSMVVRLHAPVAGTITNVTATVNTAPTGANLIIDIHKAGVTIFTTQANRPTIIAGNNDDLSSTPDVTSFNADDLFTCDIDQVGSTIAGADLIVQIRYKTVLTI